MKPLVDTYRGTNWLAWINLAPALWLIISPFALSSSGALMVNNVICALFLALLAGFRVIGLYGQSGLEWVIALLELWIFAAPWAVHYTAGPEGMYDRSVVNNMIVGAVIAVLGTWDAFATRTTKKAFEHGRTATV
jgi:hypothetical protein